MWRASSSHRSFFDARLAPALYYTVAMTPPSDPTFIDSLTSAQRTSFYERHKPIAVVMILVVFLFPFIGLFVRGLFGVVLGMLVSVLAYYLTPYVVLTIFGGSRR